MHDFRYSAKNAAGRFRFAGFGINAEKILGSRRAYHHPTDLAQINLNPVHIFAAHDGPFEQVGQVGIGELRNRFLFLAGLQISVDAAIVVLAKLRVQRAQQFS